MLCFRKISGTLYRNCPAGQVPLNLNSAIGCLVSEHDFSRVPCPPGRAMVGVKTEDLPNGTSSVFEGAAPEAEPAAAKARAALNPPIDIIGGPCLTLYSDGTPSVFEGAAPEAEPASAKAGAAHTPPIDIIGGRRLTLYSDGTPGVLDAGNENRGPPQWDKPCFRRCRLGGRACRRESPRGPHSTYRHNRRSLSNSI